MIAMDRLGSSVALAALLLLPAACGDDSPPVGSGTETETGTGSSGTDTSGASMTTTSNTDAMTSDGSSGGSTTNTTSVDTTEGTTTVEPTTSGTDTTTTEGDECDMCIDENCGAELGDCIADRDCLCWLECASDGNDQQTCAMMCGGMPPEVFFELVDCVDGDCAAECNGGMADETYMECADAADCPTTDCAAGFLGYCTPDCMGDDNNCPAPATGDIMPACGGMGGNRCILPCGNGGTCPDGMNCTQGPGNNEVCTFN